MIDLRLKQEGSQYKLSLMKPQSVVIFILLLTSVVGDCPANYNPTDIFTGFFQASTAVNTDLIINQTVGTYNYLLANSFVATPQVSITSNIIEGPLRSDQYYRVSVVPSTNRLLFTVNISYSGNSWQFIQFNFMASTRSDIQLGVYQASITKNDNSPQTFTTSMTKSIGNPVVVTFIAGFEINGASLTNSNVPLLFAVTSGQSSGNILNMTVQTDFVKTVWIGYVVYNSVSLQGSYIVRQGSVSLGQTSINNTMLYAGTTNIFGFNGFASSSATYFDYNSRLSSTLFLNVTSTTLTSLTVSYIVIETLPAQYCSTCGSGSAYENGYCVAICSSTSVSIIQNGIQSCVICDISQFMIKSQDNSSCVCAIQTYKSQGSTGCLPCSPTCVTCSGSTMNDCTSCDTVPIMGTNRVITNGACQCMSRFYTDAAGGYSCLPCHYSCLTCSSSNSTSCQSCSVNLGRILGNGVCTCTSGYTDNGQSESCVCSNPLSGGGCSVPIICSTNQVIINNVCQCASGYFNISGQCTLCAANQFYNGTGCASCSNGQVSADKTNCICNSGYNKIGNICQACKSNQVFSNSSQSCVCAANYYLVSGTCQSPPPNQRYNGSAFVCATGFYNISGGCSTCSGNQIYNPNTFTCGCADGLVLVGSNCQINTNPNNVTCPANSALFAGSCVCNQGYLNISGSCSTCSGNQIYNPTTKACECANGLVLVNGNCQIGTNPTNITCPANNVPSGNICVCAQGFFNISGVCSVCPVNQVYNSTSKTCGCTGGLVIVNGNCQVQTTPNTTCGSNAVFNGLTCACVSGAYNISGNCTVCPQNGYFNGQTCLCYPGYYNISGNCTNNPVCGQLQYFNGVSCACYPGYYNNSGVCTPGCGPNQIQVQQGCICNQGFYNISGNCTTCQQNSYFDGVNCICYNGLYLVNGTCITCTANSVFNGSVCVCAQGTFNISGSCQSCPANSNYNGSSCNCSPGFNNISGSCQVCPQNSTYNSNTNKCSCNSGYNNVSGSCQQCGPNSAYNGSVCACNTGYTLSIQNTCVSNPTNNSSNSTNSSSSDQCGTGSWNGYSCVCNQGSYLIQGKCGICPNGAYFNGQTCICYGGTYYINNMCTTCPSYSYFSGSTCTCYGGLIYSNNQCVPCPQNSYNTGSTCVCYQGIYSNTTNSCQVCSPPSTFNGTSCVCPAGYYLMTGGCILCSVGCKTCTGSNACTACNSNYTLRNGLCSTTGGNSTNGTSANKLSIVNSGFSLYPGYVVASITLNPFPQSLQANGCAYCGNVLQTVITSGKVPQILIGYNPPNTLYVLFGFGATPPSPFVASVGISSQYSQLFPGMDISQKLILNVTQAVINGSSS